MDIAKGAEADLSRRAILYNLEGMSFREYLNFTSGTEIKPVSLQEIVTHAYALPESIPHPIPLWVDYLRVGYFPFDLSFEPDSLLLPIGWQTRYWELTGNCIPFLDAGKQPRGFFACF